MADRPKVVQWYDRETDRYVKFERVTAKIISKKVTPGPYKNIHVAQRRPFVRKNARVTEAPPKKTKKKKAVRKKKPRPKKYLNNKDLLAEVLLSKEQGAMTDKLAHMLTMLCARYGKRAQFSGYSYNDDMQSFAMMQLVSTWNGFNPEKSNNPFAFYTQCIKNSFIQLRIVTGKPEN